MEENKPREVMNILAARGLLSKVHRIIPMAFDYVCTYTIRSVVGDIEAKS